ncbi:MAG: HAD family hydrolase [Sulfurospirillaceae bacterium]|nr:HAD family hydrolase [Sulfurospirillaceae bacterium]
MNSYKAVIFDLDGTLLDTLKDIAISANYALKQCGFEAKNIQSYRYFVGEGVVRLFENALEDKKPSSQTIHMLVDIFEEHYAKQYAQNTVLYEDISKLLTYLQAVGFKMAILSNKPDGFTKKCAYKYLRSWTFEAVYGQREGVERKPSPQGAQAIANELSVTCEECLYFGDTSIDMITANNAGMTPIGVLWGFRTRDELIGTGAKFIVSSPKDAIKLIHTISHPLKAESFN